MVRLSVKFRCPNILLPILIDRFGDSCCGVNDEGNMPEVGVTWPEREFMPKPPRVKLGFAALRGGWDAGCSC